MTHELRTPLTSIRAFSQILSDSPDVAPEQRARFVAIITKETERLTRLIDQVLDLAKIEAGNVEWRMAAVDLRTLLSEAVAGMSRVFEERGIQVSLQVGQGELLVRADPDRLIQVVVNLLSNAAKFCAPGRGRVEVALAEEARGLRVDVRDNGPGIDVRDQEIIFDKFRQARDSVAGQPQGSGLGLYICRRIVEHLGGRIWVSSRRGEGSCFSFTVPGAQELAGQAAA